MEKMVKMVKMEKSTKEKIIFKVAMNHTGGHYRTMSEIISYFLKNYNTTFKYEHLMKSIKTINI